MSKLTVAAIGDSLTQGFQSGAIHKTGWSYPTIVARALGLEVPLDFRVPRIPGPGLPLNLEDMLRIVHEKLGDDVSTAEWILKFPRIAHDYIDQIEDYYERGGGTLPAKFRGIYHNLAVWGYAVQESIRLTPERCVEAIRDEEGWIDDDFLGVPSASMYRTAMRVLDPGRKPELAETTQIDALARLAQEEQIDVLLLCLGANDCLGTVLSLEVHDMKQAKGKIPDDPIERLRWNLTSKAQFEDDYNEMASQIEAALAHQTTDVFVGTVPHVTIPPITTGLGAFDGKYFERYGRFFMNNGNFNPLLHKSLSRDEARDIDARIDEFNDVIRGVAKACEWRVVDLCAVLDQLAVKRNGLAANPEQALIRYYADQGITDHPLLRLSPIPSILLLRTDESGGRLGGGLFSLDGVHPSTIGYAVVAEAFLLEMQRDGVAGADPRRIPWAEVIANDNLLQAPPKIWDDVCEAGSHHATLWDLIFRALA